MKLIGIVRRIDELGRVVIPVELRKILDISEKDPVEIFAESDRIVVRKYTPSCLFCGSTNNITSFKNKLICEECLDSMRGTNAAK